VEVTSPLTFAIATFGKTFDKNQKYYFLKFSFHRRNIAQTQVPMKDVRKASADLTAPFLLPSTCQILAATAAPLGMTLHGLHSPSVFSSCFNMHVGFTNIATP